MTEPTKPPGYGHAVCGVEHLVHDGTRWTPVDECDTGWNDYVRDLLNGLRCEQVTGWAKDAESARRYAELLFRSRVPWPDYRVRLEPVVVTPYLPVPDPELTDHWQQFIDAVASTPLAPCDEGEPT